MAHRRRRGRQNSFTQAASAALRADVQAALDARRTARREVLSVLIELTARLDHGATLHEALGQLAERERGLVERDELEKQSKLPSALSNSG
jgi:hypothetical protein